MRIISIILRILVGLLFIFSGLIKANDPTGFSYKLDEYLSVFSADLEPKQDSVKLSLTSVDGVSEHSIAISSLRPTQRIEVLPTAWTPVDVEGTTLYLAEAILQTEGTELWAATLQAEDTGAVIIRLTLQATVNQKEVATETIEYASFASNDKEIELKLDGFVKPNSALVDLMQWLRNYVIGLAMFICVFEVVLGIALLIGWAPKISIGLSLAMILFFSFLTFYSAYYNKVTDCGCFGDAIKLTPWQSFNKDLILLIALLIIWFTRKSIRAVFSTPFAVKLLTVCILLTMGFTSYCWHYLPVKNYLKFKKGNDIEALATIPEGAPTDVYENIFIYAKDGVNEEFTLDQLSNRDLKAEGYEFVDRIDKLISKGYEPEIHDFKIMDEDRTTDYVGDFFANKGKKLMIVMNEIEASNTKSFNELRDIIELCKKNDIAIYTLTASSTEAVNAFKAGHRLDVPFYYGDKTNLKSIIRSNPGALLFEGNTVRKTWPSTRLPEIKRLTKLIE